jgi:hypothetical protein
MARWIKGEGSVTGFFLSKEIHSVQGARREGEEEEEHEISRVTRSWFFRPDCFTLLPPFCSISWSV